MIAAQAPSQTLADRFWTRTATNTHLRFLTMVVLGTALLALSAHVQVPFWPVKMSMQSFMVLILAATYGSRLGTVTVVAYLLQGAVGLPMFQNGGGAALFGGPTAGYLAGFVLATWVVGALSEGRAMRSTFAATGMFLVGDAIIMVLGTAWLSTLIGFEKAISAGFLVFLPAEALKISLAVALTRATDRTLKTR